MITYSNYSAVKSAVVGGMKGYSFTTVEGHICALKDNKRLKFDGASLHLSLDNGDTYPTSLDLTGICDIITRAKLYENGNILFANQTQCFYSTDSLATYHESTVLEVNGNPFVPDTYDNFKTLFENTPVIIDGKEIDVWGNYSTDSTQIRGWYTIDSGITIQSCFANNSTIPGQNFRHIHGIAYNPDDDTFYMFYGDDTSGINKGTYDWDEDQWSWEVLVDGDHGAGYYKITGLQFHDNYVYWTSDSSSLDTHGVWKSPLADYGVNEDSYTRLRILPGASIGLFGTRGTMIVAGYSSVRIDWSVDYGATWETDNLEGGPGVAAGFMYFSGSGEPDDTYTYVCQIQEDPEDEPEHDSAKGATLLLQIFPNAIL
jgi:hypothetical protein